MSFQSACESWDAVERARVIRQTFGHLDPVFHRTYKGSITFIRGGYRNVDGQMITHTFRFSGGPLFYEIVHEFLFQKLYNGGEWSSLPEGIYCWTGTVRLYKAGPAWNGPVPILKLSF